jgi:hypothetical protein
MRRCCTGLSCPAGSVATRDVPVRRAGGGRRRGRRPGRAAGRADAPALPRRGRGPVAPARPPGAAAPSGRGRRADVAGPLRPAGHGEDDAGARHLAGHQAAVRAAVGARRGRQGGPRGHLGRQAGAHLRRTAHGAVHRRGAPVLQDPAGLAAVGRRGPHRQPGRRHHREPLLLRGRPAALALPRPGPAAAVRRRRPRGAAPGADQRARPGRRGDARRRGRGAPRPARWSPAPAPPARPGRPRSTSSPWRRRSRRPPSATTGRATRTTTSPAR